MHATWHVLVQARILLWYFLINDLLVIPRVILDNVLKARLMQLNRGKKGTGLKNYKLFRLQKLVNNDRNC